jgi:hypothetical protein
MQNIILTFHSDVPQNRQDAVLAEVGGWPGVEVAAPWKKDAPPSYRRFSYARVDDQHIGKITEALQNLPEVEVAEIAPRRGL